MAGHFLLVNVPLADLHIAEQKLDATVSDVQHANIPWNRTTLGILRDAAAGVDIGNRNQLPPHVYMQFNADPHLSDAKRAYIRAASWVDNMTRPASPGLGLRQLCQAALAFWNLGRKDEALIAQIEHGAVSVEIYYRSKAPVGAEGEPGLAAALAFS